MPKKDFLDEIVKERTAKNPQFPRLVEEATARRAWARVVVQHREELKLSQTQVAAQMKTSASVVSKLEGGADVKFSTIQRYLAAIGMGLPSLPAPNSRHRGHRSAR
jgi:ribosome-binding protein aMBF1 (putative translation factor)